MPAAIGRFAKYNGLRRWRYGPSATKPSECCAWSCTISVFRYAVAHVRNAAARKTSTAPEPKISRAKLFPWSLSGSTDGATRCSSQSAAFVLSTLYRKNPSSKIMPITQKRCSNSNLVAVSSAKLRSSHCTIRLPCCFCYALEQAALIGKKKASGSEHACRQTGSHTPRDRFSKRLECGGLPPLFVTAWLKTEARASRRAKRAL